MTRPTSIYLLDFSCYRLPNHLTVHFRKFIHHSTLTGDFLPSSLDFQRKILLCSGLGKETYRQGRGRAGVEPAKEVSPWESSSQRLCTFLVPDLTSHEAKDSEGRRGLSPSERDWGDAKLWRRGGRVLRAVVVVVFLEGVAVRDMAGNLRKGQWVEAMLGLEEETRKQTNRTVRRRSGREGMVVGG
ncbi:3-ketoacyl-CoA synthase [Vigna angularis]|uniref:3-ketoacyl-CoA synthase n=1 Tax=Phaseolus angularis TaxID=3914 RepID=A0A8T0JLQ2_PHAAN|nr:3-ketoacyl-CoA synthase [Vigna angularis]